MASKLQVLKLRKRSDVSNENWVDVSFDAITPEGDVVFAFQLNRETGDAEFIFGDDCDLKRMTCKHMVDLLLEAMNELRYWNNDD